MEEKYVLVLKSYFDNEEEEVFVGSYWEIKEFQKMLDKPNYQMLIMPYEDYYK